MELNWIYCEDELPRRGEMVLFCIGGNVGEGYLDMKGVWYRYLDYPLHFMYGEDVNVEKWMPMPRG